MVRSLRGKPRETVDMPYWSAMSSVRASAVIGARQEFPTARLDRIVGAAQHHFWHVPRRRLILDVVVRDGVAYDRDAVLDAGCGDGSLVDDLVAAGFDGAGLEPWAQHLSLDPARFRCGTLSDIPWPDSAFGTVCALDVLEHVDDTAGLIEIRRVLKPGGSLIVTVPAHPWLWSQRDVEAGHRRRYTRRSLRRVLEREGFEIEQLFGYEALLLPFAALNRLAARWRASSAPLDVEDRPPRWVNRVLMTVNMLEVRLGRLVRPPTGTSLVAVARRIP